MDHQVLSQFFKTLSHPTRLMIVSELANGTRCVRDIEELIQVKQSNLSQHLSILKLNGVVSYEQQGNMKCYFLQHPDMIKDLLQLIQNTQLF